MIGSVSHSAQNRRVEPPARAACGCSSDRIREEYAGSPAGSASEMNPLLRVLRLWNQLALAIVVLAACVGIATPVSANPLEYQALGCSASCDVETALDLDDSPDPRVGRPDASSTAHEFSTAETEVSDEDGQFETCSLLTPNVDVPPSPSVSAPPFRIEADLLCAAAFLCTGLPRGPPLLA